MFLRQKTAYLRVFAVHSPADSSIKTLPSVTDMQLERIHSSEYPKSIRSHLRQKLWLLVDLVFPWLTWGHAVAGVRPRSGTRERNRPSAIISRGMRAGWKCRVLAGSGPQQFHSLGFG